MPVTTLISICANSPLPRRPESTFIRWLLLLQDDASHMRPCVLAQLPPTVTPTWGVTPTAALVGMPCCSITGQHLLLAQRAACVVLPLPSGASWYSSQRHGWQMHWPQDSCTSSRVLTYHSTHHAKGVTLHHQGGACPLLGSQRSLNLLHMPLARRPQQRGCQCCLHEPGGEQDTGSDNWL